MHVEINVVYFCWKLSLKKSASVCCQRSVRFAFFCPKSGLFADVSGVDAKTFKTRRWKKRTWTRCFSASIILLSNEEGARTNWDSREICTKVQLTSSPGKHTRFYCKIWYKNLEGKIWNTLQLCCALCTPEWGPDGVFGTLGFTANLLCRYYSFTPLTW